MTKGIVNFLFEAGLLNEIPRSGYHFLGGVKQSIAEHSFRVAVIGYCLAKSENADAGKLTQMCLLHDVVEARTGDLNYVNKKYVVADERKALIEQSEQLPFAEDYRSLLEEFWEGKSIEAKLTKDADQLEHILTLKRAQDMGNADAADWLKVAMERLKTDAGKKLGAVILSTKSDSWWFDRDDSWWVHAKKESSTK